METWHCSLRCLSLTKATRLYFIFFKFEQHHTCTCWIISIAMREATTEYWLRWLFFFLKKEHGNGDDVYQQRQNPVCLFIFNNGQREQTWHVEGWEVECLPCYGVQQHLILPLYEQLGQISSATKVTASKSLSYRRLRLIDERIKMNQNTRESDTITITTVLCKLLKWKDYIYFECFLVGDYFT